ncbi:MAG: sulfatase-like hydrolase/transferase [Oscillospiraceae bacterium]|nr:sulfatase-like hydrolase/transferase [Oscillospiraceae bacterium]
MTRRHSVWDILRPLELFLCAFLWLECIYRIFCVERFFDRGLLYILLFSIPLALVCTVLTSVWGEKGNRIAAGVLLGVVTLWYMIQAVYYTIFHTVLVTKSFGMAGQALSNYWRETLVGIGKTIPVLLLLAAPVVVFVLLRRHVALTTRADGRELLVLAGGAVVFQLLAAACINLPTTDLLTTKDLYRGILLPDVAVSRFGVMTTLRLDVSQTLFGVEEDDDVLLPDDPDSSSVSGDSSQEEPPEVVYEANVLDIDFDKLLEQETNKTLKSMHQYFGGREPTLKNEYTGMFEGKNLIMLTGEAFWIGAIHPTYTPTLYKLANEGFVFKNFYNPLWWYSTIDGEYAHCTGLIPSNQSKNSSFKITGMNKNSMYFCMGNMLAMEGYPTTAYHNHTHSYYSRHLSHPNMGYDYYGVGAGLDVKKSWPESDLEMMEKTIPQALAGEKPFHNYYMTVSGHMNYNFVGNAMSMKHRAEVADSGLSEAAQAYIACNMELDRALEYVLQQLEAAGELENTVICMSGDHYPYGLDGTGAIDELTAPGTENDLIEKYRSSLILWCGGMEEPIVVEKPCSSIDVIPTLLNLFGLDYDSRLIIGRDILSTAPGLVPTNKFCYASELGKYYANTNTFIPNEGVTVPEGYVEQTYKEVKRMVTYSGYILFNDYYRVLGLEPGTPPPVVQAEQTAPQESASADTPIN